MNALRTWIAACRLGGFARFFTPSVLAILGAALIGSAALYAKPLPGAPDSGSLGGPAKMHGTLHVDSRSDTRVKIYVDGEYQTTVAPWGDEYIELAEGSYTIKGVASDGTYGPRVIKLENGGSFCWKLNN